MTDQKRLVTARDSGQMPKLTGKPGDMLCGDGQFRPITSVAVSGVPSTRRVDTTSPLAGGGALTSDLTLSIGANSLTSAFVFVLDGQGSALTAPQTVDIYIPFTCTITSATVLADAAGNAVYDVRTDTYANYPPTGADSIVASAPPTLSGASKSTDSTLSGWTTSLSAGNTLQAYLSSVSTCKRLTLTLTVRRT